jgi:hypothetical protein
VELRRRRLDRQEFESFTNPNYLLLTSGEEIIEDVEQFGKQKRISVDQEPFPIYVQH